MLNTVEAREMPCRVATVVAALVLSRQPDPDSFTIRIVIATAVQFGFVAAVAARLRRGLPEATTTSGAQWRGRRAETSDLRARCAAISITRNPEVLDVFRGAGVPTVAWHSPPSTLSAISAAPSSPQATSTRRLSGSAIGSISVSPTDPENWTRGPSTISPVLRGQRDLRRQTDKVVCCISGVARAAGALSRPFSCRRSQLDNDLAGRPVLYCPVGFGGLVEPVPDDR